MVPEHAGEMSRWYGFGIINVTRHPAAVGVQAWYMNNPPVAVGPNTPGDPWHCHLVFAPVLLLFLFPL